MNAIISIRLSIIFVGDKAINKQVRGIVNPEMIFCQDHNLLIYSKIAMIIFKISKAFIKEVENSFESKSSDFDDDLLNVEKIVREQNF